MNPTNPKSRPASPPPVARPLNFTPAPAPTSSVPLVPVPQTPVVSHSAHLAATPPTLDPKLVKAPDAFDGTAVDRTVFREWRSKLERYVRLTSGPSPMWSDVSVRDVLSLHLTQDAFTWLETTTHLVFSSPSSLLDALETHFIEPQDKYVKRLKSELEHRTDKFKMKPSTLVSAYHLWFTTVLARLGPAAHPPLDTILDYYKEGVRPSLLKAAFAKSEPTSLADAHDALLQAEKYDPPTSSSAQSPSTPNSSSQKPRTNSHSAKAVRAALTSLHLDSTVVDAMLAAMPVRPPGARQSPPAPAPGGAPRFAPLTESEREYLRANGGCYKCRQLGHMRSACPSLSAGPAPPLPAPVAPQTVVPAPRLPQSAPRSVAPSFTQLPPAVPAVNATTVDAESLAASTLDSAFSDVGSSVSHQDLQDFATAFAAYKLASKN